MELLATGSRVPSEEASPSLLSCPFRWASSHRRELPFRVGGPKRPNGFSHSAEASLLPIQKQQLMTPSCWCFLPREKPPPSATTLPPKLSSRAKTPADGCPDQLSGNTSRAFPPGANTSNSSLRSPSSRAYTLQRTGQLRPSEGVTVVPPLLRNTSVL
jgi:hypothetical protein